jgi:chemotaxis signal transduction protein
MAADVEALRARLIDLRQSFDRAFSEPEAERAEATLALLSIRVGRERYAVRLSDIGAIEADRTITPVPSEHSDLLGIAGLRGAVVAVFDLATLLDLPRPEGPRWLVLAKGAPLAFAFSAFEGQIVVPASALASAEPGRAGRVRDVVRLAAPDGVASNEDNESLPLIDIPALVAVLERRPRLGGEHVG